jgi:hypothetical protein
MAARLSKSVSLNLKSTSLERLAAVAVSKIKVLEVL